ncbi:hypothetical protein JCM13304A_08340 [Desulfothermus okinawensis JCM 13304]
MAEIFLNEYDNFEVALKKFKAKTEQEGIYSELKKRSFYEKHSERRKRKTQMSQKRMLRRLRRLQQKGLL